MVLQVRTWTTIRLFTKRHTLTRTVDLASFFLCQPLPFIFSSPIVQEPLPSCNQSTRIRQGRNFQHRLIPAERNSRDRNNRKKRPCSNFKPFLGTTASNQFAACTLHWERSSRHHTTTPRLSAPFFSPLAITYPERGLSIFFWQQADAIGRKKEKNFSSSSPTVPRGSAVPLIHTEAPGY